MLRGTTYIYRPAGLYAHCPITAGTVPAYWAGSAVQPDCSQVTFTAPRSRRLTPAAFSLCLRRGATRLVTACSRFRVVKLLYRVARDLSTVDRAFFRIFR